MSNFLLNTEFSEHCLINFVDLDGLDNKVINFKNRKDCICVDIRRNNNASQLSSNYYIGIDWIKTDLAISIIPKVNSNALKVDYLAMLFSCLKHPEVMNHSKNLYEIKFDSPMIEIEQQKDILTPLLVIHFLHSVRTIVKKGLKKSYYKVENNLNSKIRGKLLISKTIKKNIFKNKVLYNYCAYDVFGVDCGENRMLKKALLFCQKYLILFPELKDNTNSLMSYCLSAFEMVSDDTDSTKFGLARSNAFFKEYELALDIAENILKRFGYNIKNTQQKERIKIQPFWIDMSNLFELYILGLLKDKHSNKILFQSKGEYGNTDFLYVDGNDKLIIDTKYKKKYSSGYKIEDIRQLSGYSRDKNILKKLGITSVYEQNNAVIDCLIIYPDQDYDIFLPDDLKKHEIKQFVNFYKLGVKLPVI